MQSDFSTVAILFPVSILGGGCVGATAHLCLAGWRKGPGVKNPYFRPVILFVALTGLPVMLAMAALFIWVGSLYGMSYVPLLEIVGAVGGWKVDMATQARKDRRREAATGESEPISTDS